MKIWNTFSSLMQERQLNKIKRKPAENHKNAYSVKNAEQISISLMQHPSYCRGRIYFIIIIIIIFAVGSSGMY